MIDHLTLSVADLPLAVGFYEKALAPLGYGLVAAFEQYRGFGPKGRPVFWLKHAEPGTQPMHLAFAAPSRSAVDAFHAAALGAGARDDGRPGLRPHYHPSYYGAFVVDPLGHPIEAVCHQAPPAPRRAAKKAVSKKKTASKKPAAKRTPPAARKQRRARQ
jgi:catechol 2,3-dioxygenase-like lactoylglutathione lyase family enzyme